MPQTSDDILKKVNIIRDVFTYTERFKGALFLLKIEDDVMEHPNFPLLMQDIVQLQSVGIQIVIILGTRNLIDKTIEDHGKNSQIVGGIRVTSEEVLPLIQLAGLQFSQKILSLITANGARGILGNWVKARAVGVHKGIDYQRTGHATHIRTKEINHLLKDGFIPILPTIGWNEVGRDYNVSSNEIALRFCEDLQVNKFIVISSEKGLTATGLELPEGLKPNKKGLLSNMDTKLAQALVELNRETMPHWVADFIGKSIEVLESGVDRVHLISGLIEGSLLQEIFSTWGQGTMIYSNRYANIRKAEMSDLPQLMHFLNDFIRKDFLVTRTEAEIKARLNDYCIYEIDQQIQGCAALHDRGENMAELAAVAVNPAARSSGIGRGIVDHLFRRGKRLGFKKVYVLTTLAEDWFQSFGFKPASVEELSTSAKERYNQKRNSKVLIKVL